MIFQLHNFDFPVSITVSVIQHFPVSVLVEVKLTEVYFSVIALFQFQLQLIETTLIIYALLNEISPIKFWPMQICSIIGCSRLPWVNLPTTLLFVTYMLILCCTLEVMTKKLCAKWRPITRYFVCINRGSVLVNLFIRHGLQVAGMKSCVGRNAGYCIFSMILWTDI